MRSFHSASLPVPSQTFFREAGSGPGVVCIHANAGTSGQWRALMEHLAPRLAATLVARAHCVDPSRRRLDSRIVSKSPATSPAAFFRL